MTIEQPLLAGTAKDYSIIKYPVMATPKLDGIRCLIVNGKAVSRNFKEIPNKYIANLLPKIAKEGMDGELLLKRISKFPNPKSTTYKEECEQIEKINALAANGNCQKIPFNYVSSEIMSFEGEPDFEYQIFDWVKDDASKRYEDRINDILKEFETGARITMKSDPLSEVYPVFMNRYTLKIDTGIPQLIFVPVKYLYNEASLTETEEKYVAAGYEGLMIRSLDGKYKFGRSTAKEGYLLKIKRFEDSEAIIEGYQEKISNQNEKTINEFGYTERSSAKEGMVLADTLGALHVKDPETGITFDIGSGFDDVVRNEIWRNKDKYLGKLVKYKHQPSGKKEKPRFPVFIGFRDPADM